MFSFSKYGWGRLPAYGLYVRHAKDIQVNHTQIEVLNNEGRPGIAFDDVQKIRLNQVDILRGNQAAHQVVIKDSEDVCIQDCEQVSDWIERGKVAKKGL